MTAHTGTAARWLSPLLPSIPGLVELDGQRLSRFEETLARLQDAVGPDVDRRVRSQQLLMIRSELARTGHLGWAVPANDGGQGGPALVQTLMQFICGYYDADLRDSTGLGHGRLIARFGSSALREYWLPRLLAGELAAIAITEPHGGSQVHATTTSATAHPDGTWTLAGRKTSISRLEEASVFITFFRDPAGRLTAGVIDAAADGLQRHPVTPAGLAGWAWGELILHDVRPDPNAVLASPGEGMALLREHFAHYRPLVAATALGAAAAVHDLVAAQLCARRGAGIIADLRDNALIALGRAYGQLNAALLAALTAQQLSEHADQRAHTWGCAIKAHAIDIAYSVVSELALLAGASGFTAGSRLTKAQHDLRALLYADGIHDSLYRSAGRALTAGETAAGTRRTRPSRRQHTQIYA